MVVSQSKSTTSMMTSFKLFVAFACLSVTAAGSTATTRSSSERLRSPDSDTLQSAAIAIPSHFFQTLVEGMMAEEKDLDQEKDEYDAVMEVFESLASNLAMSMSMATFGPTESPRTTNGPTVPETTAPSAATPVDTIVVSTPQTDIPSVAPTPVILPPVATTGFPTDPPTPFPTASMATRAPSIPPQTSAPTLANCPGLSAAERIEQILNILEAGSGSTNLLDLATDQGKATEWILNQDEYRICPQDDKLLQRWALAVMYFATGGEEWFQCSANLVASDNCGVENPFVGSTRFLAPTIECEWAGISCIDGCVTEIEFGTNCQIFSCSDSTFCFATEENNLVGTIPTEMGLLTDLLVWGMERGRLGSTIPTEIGQLSKLLFLDLDYNELTGVLTTELFSLKSLTQLDLNNNKLTGTINGVESFLNIEFLQLHDNLFSGTVPASMGSLTEMTVFTLHESSISGDMPQEVCDLLSTANQGGKLTSLISDCTPPNQNINCDCCTDCRIPQQ